MLLTNLLRRIFAFFIRDLQLALSYRLEFFIKILWILGITTTFFFISQIDTSGVFITRYENWEELLPAWLVGMAMLNYFLVGFSALSTYTK